MTLRSAPTASARSIYSPGKRQPSSTTLSPFPSAIPLPHLIPFLLLPLSPPLAPSQIQAHLINNQHIPPRNPRPPLPRHLIPPRHINHINNEIRQLPRVIRRQIIPPALNQQYIGLKLAVQGLQGVQVGGDVFAHGGVGAAAGFDGGDARGGEGGVSG